ncbi:WG repeat-containing protein [Campylobacter sp. CCS1377]|uniref:WG repeat-containing protein n=1 Tax=Campylobacter sp. CCS1377 TaxID=3158229 RepID=A0AAU7E8T4_9BACT|nr:WG repeat-containing protein [Campylobacter jejuni]
MLVEPKFYKASYRQNDIWQVEIDKKLGLFDIKNKQFILEPKFDDMYNFYNKFIGVYFQGKEGLFDINNRRFVLEPKFEISSCGGTSKVGLNGKYGIINDKAEFIVPIKYDYISSCFSNDLSFVSIKNKMGYINKNAELVIPAKFETVTPFKYGFAQVKLDRNKKFGLINTKGDLILPFEFDSIYYIEPLAKFSVEFSEMREANKDISASKE